MRSWTEALRRGSVCFSTRLCPSRSSSSPTDAIRPSIWVFPTSFARRSSNAISAANWHRARFPYHASYVADNDLALGRIVAFLSKTSIWKDSALFVTEDDAQGGVDHVDAHRSILLVASPWVKPGSVSHQHTSMGSITRTMDELLGLGAMNLEDALAGEIGGIFDSTPHLDIFSVRPSDTRIFSADKARFAKPKTKEEAAALHDVDDADEIRKEIEKSAGKLRKPKDND
jgi:hypothetical protein